MWKILNLWFLSLMALIGTPFIYLYVVPFTILPLMTDIIIPLIAIQYVNLVYIQIYSLTPYIISTIYEHRERNITFILLTSIAYFIMYVFSESYLALYAVYSIYYMMTYNYLSKISDPIPPRYLDRIVIYMLLTLLVI